MAEPQGTPAALDDDDGFAGPRRGLFARLEDLALGATLWCSTRAPQFALDGALALFARLAYVVDGRRNRAARVFLEAALGPDLDPARRERLVRGAYRHLFAVVAEVERFIVRVPREETLAHVSVRLAPQVQACLEARTPCVFVTPHLGNWEVGSLVAERIGFSPFTAVAKPAKNHFVSRRILRSRAARGLTVLPRRGAMTEAPRLVREGSSLGLLLDQRARVKPVLAPFFGRPARCDRSAGILIRRLGVPLVIGVCYRADRPLTFDFRAEVVISPAELSGMSPVDVATRVNREFERMILERPEQYFWLHDRYRDTPARFEAGGGEV
jgi:KDO2-lipid IV(A) lauroyltransferase